MSDVERAAPPQISCSERAVRADERRVVAAYLERMASAGVGADRAATLREAAGWCRDDRLWEESGD